MKVCIITIFKIKFSLITISDFNSCYNQLSVEIRNSYFREWLYVFLCVAMPAFHHPQYRVRFPFF